MFSKADKAKATPIPVRSVPSLVSTDLEITGDLKTPGEVQLDGTIEGDIACGKLMVGENACITGLVEADEVVIRGKIIGRVKAHSVELAKTAHVVGDIWHDTLAVDAGAFLEGHCKPNEAQPAIRPAVSRPAEVVTVTEGTTKSASSN